MTPENIEIWRLNLEPYLDEITELYNLLDDEEKARASKFYRERDRRKFIAGTALLRSLLSRFINIDPGKISFGRSRTNKPFLADCNHAIHFNVSHSEQCTLIAIGGTELGIDVEYYRFVTWHQGEMGNLFSDTEITFINEQVAPQKTFYKLWTRKEALLKGTAQGIIDDLNLLPCLNGTHVVNKSLLHTRTDWSVQSFEADEYNVASIACEGGFKNIIFHDFEI